VSVAPPRCLPLRIPVRGGRAHLAARLFLAPGLGAPGRTAVLAQGIALTADSRPVPEMTAALLARRIHVLTYDPEGFGESDTTPDRMQVFVPGRQRDELRDVVRHAAGLPEVDEARIGVAGYSYGAGFGISVASDPANRVKALVARAPFALGLPYVRTVSKRRLVRLGLRGTPDGVLGPLRGREPRYVPIVGDPTEPCLFPRPGAGDLYLALTGPTWRNVIAPRLALGVGLYLRPWWHARRVDCPLLVTIGAQDEVAMPGVAAAVAARAPRGQLHPPVPGAGHFTICLPPFDDSVASDEADFLDRHL
jgi:pimeloyl-ACP methyl ester carboxylesterase